MGGGGGGVQANCHAVVRGGGGVQANCHPVGGPGLPGSAMVDFEELYCIRCELHH